jgi:hypothetical protein
VARRGPRPRTGGRVDVARTDDAAVRALVRCAPTVQHAGAGRGTERQTGSDLNRGLAGEAPSAKEVTVRFIVRNRTPHNVVYLVAGNRVLERTTEAQRWACDLIDARIVAMRGLVVVGGARGPDIWARTAASVRQRRPRPVVFSAGAPARSQPLYGAVSRPHARHGMGASRTHPHRAVVEHARGGALRERGEASWRRGGVGAVSGGIRTLNRRTGVGDGDR